MTGIHYSLTSEQRDEVLDSIDDRIERLTLLANEIDDAEAVVQFSEAIEILREARRAITRPARHHSSSRGTMA